MVAVSWGGRGRGRVWLGSGAVATGDGIDAAYEAYPVSKSVPSKTPPVVITNDFKVFQFYRRYSIDTTPKIWL